MKDLRAVIIAANRQAYGVEDIIENQRAMTVGELIDLLSDFDQDAKVVLSHNNGYTYGGIIRGDIWEYEPEDENNY